MRPDERWTRFAAYLAPLVAREMAPLLRAEMKRSGSSSSGPSWVSAKQLANHLAVSVWFVYEHKDELGAERINPTAKRSRLRFRLDRAERAFVALQDTTEPSTPKVSGPQRPTHTEVELLPIKTTTTRKA